MVSAPARERVLIVGIGEVARTHLAVLATADGATVVGGVDPMVRDAVDFRGRELPVYPSLNAAADLAPTLVVVATPTPTHADVCAAVADMFPGVAIMVEKPAADSLADARRLLGDRVRFPRLWVAYHLRYAPEVAWGLAVARSAGIGKPIRARSVLTDPYEAQFPGAAARFGSSWLDSGINALSVLDRFVELTERLSLRGLGERHQSIFEGRFGCRSGIEAMVMTSWHVSAAAKTTVVEYSSGATLVMDHTAVAGYLVDNGRIADVFGSDGSVDRRYSHYLALYREQLGAGGPCEDDLRLHELLLPEAGPIPDAVRARDRADGRVGDQ